MGDGGQPRLLLRWTSDTGVEEASASGLGAVTPLRKKRPRRRVGLNTITGRYRLVIEAAPRGSRAGGCASVLSGNVHPVCLFCVGWKPWRGREQDLHVVVVLPAFGAAAIQGPLDVSTLAVVCRFWAGDVGAAAVQTSYPGLTGLGCPCPQTLWTQQTQMDPTDSQWPKEEEKCA